MDPAHKQLIQDNFMDLLREIKPQIRFVSKDILAARIISVHMYEDIIKGHKTQSDQTEALLELLIKRGPRAFQALYRSILAAELYGAADILEPEKGPHWAPLGSVTVRQQQFATIDAQSKQDLEKEVPEIELPEKWSMDASQKDFWVKTVSKDSKVYIEYKSSLTPLGKEYWYQMRHSPRGRAVIINNKKFKTLPTRTGSEQDTEGLEHLFTQLGFIVNIQEDKTKDEIMEILRTECEMDHNKFDCFILVILSHGCKRAVFGTDGDFGKGQTPINAVMIKDIKKIICSCTSLNNKPKLFFIQACEGFDSNMEKATDQNSADELIEIPEVKETLENLLNSNADQVDCAQEKTTPSDADVFIAMATTPDIAIHNKVVGTSFIQAVIYILANYSHMFDINQLMILVNRLLYTAMTSSGKKKLFKISKTMGKTFAFFPGLEVSQ